MQIRIAAELACVLEATARKPGNVHRDRDHRGLTYLQMLASASAIGPDLENVAPDQVGRSILDAVRATQTVVSTNSNLGIVLLLAPLAAAANQAGDLRTNLKGILDSLSIDDAKFAFEAIRLANPGGLGSTAEQDVSQTPTVSLLVAMQMAADRDAIALQYANGFEQVFGLVVPSLLEELSHGRTLEAAITLTYLRTLAEVPDSLIARKHSPGNAVTVSAKAKETLHSVANLINTELFAHPSLTEFDRWLIENRYNPGTTADLIAAGLFCGLQSDAIALDRSFGTIPTN